MEEEVIWINITSSTGERFGFRSSAGIRIVEFKVLLAKMSYAHYDEQNEMKLIYKGEILEDDRTLQGYGLQSNHTIYMEGGKLAFFDTTDDDDDTVTGMPGPDTSQLIPVITMMMQSLLSSSRYMKQIVGHNPQLQSIFDSDPQLRDLLQNPDPQEFLRLTSPQMMQMDDQRPEHVDISLDASAEKNRFAATKVCKGAPCGFSDAKTSSNEAKERSASMWKLWAGIVLCVIFMTVEVVCGIKANSLAILTDAAHLLSDVAAFAISLFSVWAAGWEATPRQSYGFFRIEILGTLVSIQIIWLLTGILVYEAVERLINGTVDVQGSLMFGISTFGLVVNIVMMFILGHDHGHGHGHNHGHGHSHGHGHDHEHSEDDVEDVNIHGVSVTTHQHHNHSHGDDHGHDHDHHHDHPHEEHSQPLLKTYSPDKAKKKKRGNINVQGAYLHVLGDLIQSIGVMIGAAVIWYNPKLKVIDPICTLLFSLIVLYTTVNMLRDILEVLMESTPREIDATSLERGLCEIDEVVAIHELHIWAITVGKVLLACHVRIRREADADMTLDKVVDYIKREYNISHVTIQIERE